MNAGIVSKLGSSKLTIYVMLAIGLVLGILLFDFKLFTGGDNATYICLAKSILSGKGYKDIYHPDEPLHTQYPPGYPVMLAGMMLVAGKSIVPLKLLSLLLFLGSLFLCYRMLRLSRSGLALIFPVLLLALNPDVLDHSHWTLTEVPFLFFFLLTIYCFEKWDLSGSSFFFYLGTISSICCYYLRSIGVAVLAGAFFYLLYKRQFKKTLVLVLLALIFISPWMIRNSSLPQAGGYLDQFLAKDPYNVESPRLGLPDLTSRVWFNVKKYGIDVVPGLIFPSFYQTARSLEISRTLALVFCLVIVFLLLWGLVRDFLDKRRFYHFALIFYLGICLLWPEVWTSSRFLLPVLPLLFLAFINGASFRIAGAPILAIILAVLATFSTLQVIVPRIPRSVAATKAYLGGDQLAGYPLDWVRFFQTAEWTKDNTPPSAVVLSRKPNLFYLGSDRKSFVYPMTPNHQEMLESVRKADYVIVDAFSWTGTTARYLIPALMEKEEWFQAAYVTTEPQTFVLKVKEEAKTH